MKSRHSVIINAITTGPRHHFFGYYDKCPWSANGKYLLTMETSFMDRFPERDSALIGYIDISSDYKLKILDGTHAWNWQQGAMLQWLPSDSNHCILYNTRVQNNIQSKILDIISKKARILPKAIAAVSHSGKVGLSINFGRLYHTRKAYGYGRTEDPWHDDPHPRDDGIYSIDMVSGINQLIISLDRIARFQPETSRGDVKHWFNHLAFNPDDTRFCFLHRFEIPEIKHFGTRLFTANTDGSDIRCLWTGHVSHFDWFDNQHLLAWAAPQNINKGTSKMVTSAARIAKKNRLLNRGLRMLPFIRKRFIGGNFLLFADKSNRLADHSRVGVGTLTEDGHCSYSPNRHWLVLDTYPDLRNCRKLALYNVSEHERIDIGRFYSPPGIEENIRCDLHPRWNRDGTKICIDSLHEGSRQMYVLDVADITQVF
jgi:hypothetical protein